jgi:hypothetical protein
MKSIIVVPALALFLGACASFPPPSDRLAQAESGVRAAQEIGAASEPSAALHLKMATDQIADARKLMSDGENARASAVLLRAQSDAELSLQLAKEARARNEASAALARIAAMHATAQGGGQ